MGQAARSRAPTAPLKIPPAAATTLGESAAGASLVVLTGARAGRTFPIEAGEVVLGRGDECTVRLDADDVSRRHARIAQIGDGRWLIEDLGSRNGTLVNGVPARRRVLDLGDRISLGGGVLLLFTRHDRVQEEIFEQEKLRSIGLLAAGIAHDFNNLLAALIVNAGVLTATDPNTPLGDAEVQDILGDMRAAGTRAAQMTRQLLGFARRGSYEDNATNVTDLVHEVVRLCKRSFAASIEVSAEVEPGVVVRGDSPQLHQVLMNLLINARDAMPRGGKLALRVRREAGGVHGGASTSGHTAVIEVEDTGVGMDEETQRRIFEPFFTTKGKGRGTGLGLATVEGVVKSHGGEIRVRSTVGRGTTFEVRLPAEEPEPACSEPTKPQLPPSPAARRLVLIADEEELTVRGASRLVRQLGFQVEVARNALEAERIYRAKRGDIELVLLGVALPGTGAEEIARRLRELDPTVKMLATSAPGDSLDCAITAALSGLDP